MRLLPLLLALALGSGAASAQGEEPSAGEILEQARDAQRLDRGYQRLKMVLVSKSGTERVRELELYTRRDVDATRTRLNLLSPAEVADTVLILVDAAQGEDQQLLYLPALKKVSLLVGLARRSSFVGSDLSHEDLDLSYADGATARILAQDDQGWEIELLPAGEAPWSRLQLRVERAGMLARRVDFFDQGGTLVKQIRVEELNAVDGRALPQRTVIADLRRGTQTRVEVLETRTDLSEAELPLSLFQSTSLQSSAP
jgi:hypothetical protein